MKSQECFQTSLAQELLLVSRQSKIMTAGGLRLEVINCHLAGLHHKVTCSDSNLEQNSKCKDKTVQNFEQSKTDFLLETRKILTPFDSTVRARKVEYSKKSAFEIYLQL